MRLNKRGLLHWRFYRFDLVLKDGGGTYMKRWIFEHPLGSIRLHGIMQSDLDDELHDHPWSFLSIMLRGSYMEHAPLNPLDPCGERVAKPRGAGSIAFRRAEDPHRLDILEGPVWTLVFGAPWRRRWGFWSEGKWVYWKEFETAKEDR